MLCGVCCDDRWAWCEEEWKTAKQEIKKKENQNLKILSITKLSQYIFDTYWTNQSTKQNQSSIQPPKGRHSPFTVRVTSLSPTPIRGTMALQVYVPASSWVTALSCKVLPLLSTYWEPERKVRSVLEQERVRWCGEEADKRRLRDLYQGPTHCGGSTEVDWPL